MVIPQGAGNALDVRLDVILGRVAVHEASGALDAETLIVVGHAVFDRRAAPRKDAISIVIISYTACYKRRSLDINTTGTFVVIGVAILDEMTKPYKVNTRE
jgi:hypothetical protein